MMPKRSLHEAAAFARTNDPQAEFAENTQPSGDAPRRKKGFRPSRQAWMWWGVVSAAVFAALSVVMFATGDWWLLALPVVAATAAVVFAAHKLRKLWSSLTGLTRVGGLTLVVAVAALFAVGAATQTSLGNRPLLTGTDEAVAVGTVNEFAAALPAIVDDARLAGWPDEQVRTQQPTLDAAASRWQQSSQELASRRGVSATTSATDRMVSVQDLTSRLLVARVELATQPSPGRQVAFGEAVDAWEQAVADLVSELDVVADELGFGGTGRTWEQLAFAEENP